MPHLLNTRFGLLFCSIWALMGAASAQDPPLPDASNRIHTPVVTDTAALPAEDRDSSGAVVVQPSRPASEAAATAQPLPAASAAASAGAAHPSSVCDSADASTSATRRLACPADARPTPRR